MDKAQLQAVEAQEKIRALAVGAGLMTQAEADEYIIVQVVQMDAATLKKLTCDCGVEHDAIPLEIGISRLVSAEIRDKIMLLMQYTSGPAN
jgi:hypothetical protein